VSNAAVGIANQNRDAAAVQEVASLISVDVLGYGGDESEGDQEEERRKKRAETHQL
jgi:hypothetical protein